MGKNLMLSLHTAGLPDEAPAAARLIYHSDPAYFDLWFAEAPRRAAFCLEYFWHAHQGPFSHKNAWVWRDADQPVVLAIHYPAARDTALTAENNALLDALPLNSSLLRQNEARLAWLFPHLPENVWYLRTLTVDPEYRSQGVGQKILHEIEQTARAQGSNELHTDVDSGNPGAVRFYQKNGFELMTETRVPMLEKYNLPTSLRMVKTLA